MDQISFLVFFVIFPFFVTGYATYEFWRTPEKYYDRMKAFYGEDSWIAHWLTSRYVVLAQQIVTLVIFLSTFVILLILLFQFFSN